MNWINYILYAVGMTCLTGSVWTLIWWLASAWLRRNGNTRLIYYLLKFAMAGYVLPILFLLLILYQYMVGGTNGWFFLITPDMQSLWSAVLIVWLTGVLLSCLVYIPRLMLLYKICMVHMPASHKEEALVADLCKELKIRNKVRVCYGYSVAVPFIYGIARPCIYLPVRSYSERDLDMILRHELTHYKHGDVFWKPVFVLFCCIYWFNPMAWAVSRQFQKWAEAACDLSCCEWKYHPKEYFNTILAMMTMDFWKIGTFAPTWQEGEDELKWRIMIMKRSSGKKQKKWLTAVIMAMVVMISIVCTYGVEAGAEQLYASLCEKTVTESDEEGMTDSLEEYVVDASEIDGLTIIEEETDGNARGATIIDWALGNGVFRKTGAFKKNVGETINVSVSIEPGDKIVKVGIYQPDYTLRYVQGSDYIAHTFTLTQKGYYRVYVWNESGADVTVVGFYTK